MINILPLLLLSALKYTESKCSETQEQSHLWKVTESGRSNPIFLFGTIHIAWSDVWHDVHPNVHSAFEAADTVILELALNNPKILETLSKCRNLPPGVRLEKLIGKHLFSKIERYLKSRKRQLIRSFFALQSMDKHNVLKKFHEITVEWQYRKPTWVLFMLFHLLHFNNDGPPKESVQMLDAFLAEEAQKLGKKIKSIESPEEQCEPLHSMSTKEISQALEQTLSHLLLNDGKKPREIRNSETMLEKYQCGKLDETIFESTNFLESDSNSELSSLQQRIKNDMITSRNKRMAERLHGFFEDKKEEIIFVAIGAAHFIGQSNIITKLKQLHNYSIAPIMNDEILKLDYIRPLRSFKGFRNLWEREQPKSPLETGFVVWQEQYPKEIFTSNGSQFLKFI